MNFWMIFLCLLIGAFVGYQFGKYRVLRKVREHLEDMTDSLKKATESVQKLKEERMAANRKALEKIGVAGFDTRYYKVPDGRGIPEGFDRKKELDMVGNLIETMTRKGAMDQEIGRAVRYSMVAIDTEKHGLDWKRAKQDEGIDLLTEKYMNKELTDNGQGN